MRRLIIYLSTIFLYSNSSFAQGEFNLEYTLDMDISENYDGTYTVLGEIDVLGWGSFISKLQPNGEALWEIKFEDEIGQSAFWATKTLTDSIGNIYIG